ncbi:alpha-N-arabinofuranosidase [Sphingobium sp. SCG-1]|uniref:glycoside hydrolase family 43 protein n=1 Tax=Sphingobium sp. SCG-1 TaxID=2072936 RepID=UPI000CD6C097|nr:glycoside hydrolase family 43 protein [Sphingobium sp. SCG-1]AUW57223.1 alpha-N-arabinofuranosidase [Sphingobium sp. SCG-1]
MADRPLPRAAFITKALVQSAAITLLAALPNSTTSHARTAADATFTNPLLTSGPDPWVFQYRGVYYYTHTMRDRITLWRTRDITDLAHAERKVVWTPPEVGKNAHLIWAPELHRLNGKWYIYYSATESGFKDDAHRGVFVLENASKDPLAGEWIDRGRVNTKRAGIDGTVFKHRGGLYFAYSPYVGAVSGLALAKLANPWTIKGEETLIAEPDKEWENQGGRRILEGPEFLAGPKGQIFLTYSAGACWSDNYSLGLLSASAGADLLAKGSWTKRPQPVLSSANGIFATGHNGFFRSPDGREQWIVYHANPAANMGCTLKRSPFLSRVNWTANGDPDIARPTAPSVRQPKPSGTHGIR